MTSRGRAAAIGGALLGVLACGDGAPARAPALAELEVVGVVAAARASHALRTPRRCAQLDRAASDLDLALPGGRARLAGDTLAVAADDDVVIGFVADARTASPATLAQLAGFRAELARREVDLVVTLGGMGDDEAALVATLGAIASGAWATLAVPGDREPLTAHRRAVARLRAAGHAVVDGSQIRFATVADVVIAAHPGAGTTARLLDPDGCVHQPADGGALARALAARPGLRIVASHAPPRGTGVSPSDLAGGGVQIGDAALAAALGAARPALVVHGLIDEAGLGPAHGATELDAGATLALGSGAAEASPVGALRGEQTVTGAALVVSIAGGRARWDRVLTHAVHRHPR